MPYFDCKLPEYPCKEDMWDKLREEKRPILIYGMGNGADKLIARFEMLNIKYADIFASDGFVRGHSFRGVRVKSFSEIKETYEEFVIVLSFASNRAEVMEMLAEIDGKYDMYIPDMPVAGEEYFDREFFNRNYKSIFDAYERLFDDASRNAFASVICYKLSGKLSFLNCAYSSKEELYSLINTYGNIYDITDAGAYNGDTVREAIEFFPKLRSVTAIEADSKNFKKLLRFSEQSSGVDISCINSAVWSAVGEGSFLSSGNRNSSVNATASHEHSEDSVSLITVDSIKKEKTDYIKYDVEGAELEALIGSHNTITLYKPCLLVSLYHRSCDIFSLVNYIGEKYPFYELYIRRLKCVPAWELDLIVLPKK